MMDGLFGPEIERKDRLYHVLVIYDITDTNKRNRLARYLNGYGIRVQKSAFEGLLTKRKTMQMLDGLKVYAKAPDSIRVYRWSGEEKTTQFGKMITVSNDSVVVL